MSILEFFKNLTMGGWVAFFVALGALVDIAPIKIYPIQWLGNRLNAGMNKRVDKIERKLDEHVAESYRNNIFDVQDKLIENKKLTKEEWKKALKSCSKYNKYIEENELDNGLAEEAIKFIKHQYGVALDTNSFLVVIEDSIE